MLSVCKILKFDFLAKLFIINLKLLFAYIISLIYIQDMIIFLLKVLLLSFNFAQSRDFYVGIDETKTKVWGAKINIDGMKLLKNAFGNHLDVIAAEKIFKLTQGAGLDTEYEENKDVLKLLKKLSSKDPSKPVTVDLKVKELDQNENPFAIGADFSDYLEGLMLALDSYKLKLHNEYVERIHALIASLKCIEPIFYSKSRFFIFIVMVIMVLIIMLIMGNIVGLLKFMVNYIMFTHLMIVLQKVSLLIQKVLILSILT